MKATKNLLMKQGEISASRTRLESVSPARVRGHICGIARTPRTNAGRRADGHGIARVNFRSCDHLIK